MAQLLHTLKQQFFDSNGEPLAGGKVHSYLAGTTTPAVTYSDYDETPNTNPIILDANGEADIWIGSASYKFVITDPNDVVLRTIDDVASIYPGSVTTDKIANDAVTRDKIAADVAGNGLSQNANGSLQVNVDDSTIEISGGTLRAKDAGITAAKLAANSVPTSKIVDEAVTLAKLDPAVLGFLRATALGTAYLNWSCVHYQPFTATINAATETFTGARIENGSVVLVLSVAGTTGLDLLTEYFVINQSFGSFQLSETLGGSAVALATNGSAVLLPILPRSSFTASAYGNSVFVFAASTGGVIRSLDGGATWVCAQPAEENPWNGLAFGNDTFVAVSESGTNRVMRSTDDGATWSAVAAAEANPWKSVAFGNDTFVALSSDGTNRVMRSTNDGISWSAVSAPGIGSSIAFGDGVFIASSSGGIMYSTDDGLTWTEVSITVPTGEIVFGDGVFLSVADGGIARSTDNGLTWTEIESDIPFYKLAYGNGSFVASSFGDDTILLTVDNGTTWQAANQPTTSSPTTIGASLSSVFDSIVFGGGRFIGSTSFEGDRGLVRSLQGSEV